MSQSRGFPSGKSLLRLISHIEEYHILGQNTFNINVPYSRVSFRKLLLRLISHIREYLLGQTILMLISHIQEYLLTLTAAIVTKYYSENASGAIASSREHLNVQENADRAATHGGLACRVMGLVCERSADRNPGEPPHYCSPYVASDRLFWLRG